jgi:uncharacterized protein (DUF2236 family)
MTEWLFGPGSMTWKVNRHSVLLLGGRAALLMQLAHPSVAAGVADHSDFRTDPFGRLRRTLDVMLTIVFGDRATATKAVAHVNAVHDGVVGSRSDGSAYFARDPHLLLWVFSTLVDSAITVYRDCVGPLTEEEVDLYYDEGKELATMFGIPADILPPSYGAMKRWMSSLIESGEVVVTPLAREIAAPILRPLRVVPRRFAEASAVATAALLPPPIREGYGLKLGPIRSALWTAGKVASRRGLPILPGVLRTFPAARRAAS